MYRKSAWKKLDYSCLIIVTSSNHPKKKKKKTDAISGGTGRVFCISSPVRKKQAFNSQTKYLKKEGAKIWVE